MTDAPRSCQADVEGLARIGVACLQLLLVETGSKFDEGMWHLLCSTLTRLFEDSTPHELISSRSCFPSCQEDDAPLVRAASSDVRFLLPWHALLPPTSWTPACGVLVAIVTTTTPLHHPPPLPLLLLLPPRARCPCLRTLVYCCGPSGVHHVCPPLSPFSLRLRPRVCACPSRRSHRRATRRRVDCATRRTATASSCLWATAAGCAS